jgi:type IV pilus assembly protein PilV
MLIEALLGILIFSIGILAVLGLQAVSVKNTIDAQYRTEASFLANQIIGNMWTECGTTCTALNAYNTTGGSSATMISWRTTVAARLPGVVVGGTNSPTIVMSGNTATVTIFWQLPGASSSVHQFQVVAQINAAT